MGEIHLCELHTYAQFMLTSAGGVGTVESLANKGLIFLPWPPSLIPKDSPTLSGSAQNTEHNILQSNIKTKHINRKHAGEKT